jgi:RNA polymerase sigma factor (sigma-70 family)
MAPKAYLRASVSSVAADYLERQIQSREDSLEALREKDQLPPQFTEFSEPSDVVIRCEDVEEVLSAMKLLPARMAEAMRLRYLEDLDYESIAKRLGLSVNTIKSDVRRAPKRVRKILKARDTYSRAPK